MQILTISKAVTKIKDEQFELHLILFFTGEEAKLGGTK